MATPSLLDLTPLRQPTARDRTQLIEAVSKQVAWQQQTALHLRQQARLRRFASAVGAGTKRSTASTATAVKPSQSLVTLQYQVWGMLSGRQSSQKVSSPADVAKLFQQDSVEGRLLILGEPGSGKTQTLLTLASDLLKEARNSTRPIPVLLDLSGWQGEPIGQWAAAKLWELYRVPDNCAMPWLRDAQITLLLDGFDNLELAKQRTCAAAIDAFLRGNMNQTAALCCRRQVIERSGINFSQFNCGVHLVPLVAQQVKDYATGLEQPDVWQGIKGSKVLQQLARLPLLLNFLVEFYNDQSIANQADLVQQYTTHQLTTVKAQKPPYSPRDTQRYLSWLANYLAGRDRTFHIESLGPDALPESQRWLYRLLVGLILGAITGFFVHPMFGVAVALYTSQVDVEAFPKYRLSMASLNWATGLSLFGRALIPGTLLAMVLGSIGGLGAGSFGFGRLGFTIGGLVGLLIGLGIGCFFELRSGLQGSIQLRQQPNQDIFYAVRNLFIVLVIGGALLTLGMNLVAAGMGKPATDLISNQALKGIAATGFAGILWASCGIQHFVIRGLLSASNALPLNLAHFLNFAADQLLIQKVGGGYRFIHEQVREQFSK
ncbi:MAG TPA: hypothetical protein V6D29_11085 [Leptolyngbyaceae cyanobacterium]